MKKASVVTSVFALTALAYLAGCQEASSTASQPNEASSDFLARTINPTLVLKPSGVPTSNGFFGSTDNPLYSVKNLFDGSLSTYWVSKQMIFSATSTANVQIQYGAAAKITNYTLVGRYDGLKGRLPKAWVLQGSNDATASVSDAVASTKWTTVDNRSNIDTLTQWVSKTTKATVNFAVANPGLYSRYRICVSQINGKNASVDGSLPATDLIEITLSAKVSGIATSNGNYSAEYSADKAFDSSYVGYYDHWISTNHPTFTGPANIQLAYSMPVPVASYTLIGRFDVLKDRLPKSWVLQGSNSATALVGDAIASTAWTKLDEQTNFVTGVNWVASGDASVKTFATLPTWMTSKKFTLKATATYSKYRLCVTAVNGSTVVDIHEIEFNQP